MEKVDSTGRLSKRIGLLAPEVCTRGGIQTFMLRIAEVIGEWVKENKAASGDCISLNDSTECLRQNLAMPSEVNVNVWGAKRSKLNFFVHTLRASSSLDVLIVGSIGLAPIALILKALGRVRAYYVILHGLEAWKRVDYLDRRALLSAKGIIATTKYTAEECARYNHIPSDRFHIIPLCTNEQRVTPAPDFRLDGEFKLLCVARQAANERYKGFEQMFQALLLLKESYPGICLNLVGDGDDQPRLKGIASKLGVGPQVNFLGALSEEDLAAAYEDCDIFVMPSKREGFGIVFLEAMRRGKPCIGGNHGGTPDVIEHGKSGYLVEYEESSALADFIRTLIVNTSLREEMGRRGRVLVEGKFSRQNFQISYEKLVMDKCDMNSERI